MKIEIIKEKVHENSRECWDVEYFIFKSGEKIQVDSNQLSDFYFTLDEEKKLWSINCAKIYNRKEECLLNSKDINCENDAVELAEHMIKAWIEFKEYLLKIQKAFEKAFVK